jgi:hypothetical protein
VLTGEGYTERDEAVSDTVSAVAKAGPVLVVGGEEINDADARAMMRRVVEAELANWVPGASQRLIHRASALLGGFFPAPSTEDHGPDRARHPLCADWVGGMYLHRCVSCGRLFR